MPSATEDPFPAVQREVQGLWHDLSSRFSSLSASERQRQIQALEYDINDLADAVRIARQDRLRFRISETELVAREKFVADMQTNIASLSQSQHNLFQAHRETSAAPRDVFVGNELQQQEIIMEQQDEQLEHLAGAVERIGVMGRDMNVELEEQGQMLDGLGEELDDTLSRMKRVRQRLDRFIEEAGPRQFCTMVVLCIIFLVLTFLVVTT